MMTTLEILAFGITRDILGGPTLRLEIPQPMTVGQLRAQLMHQYPALQELSSLGIARNSQYAADEEFIQPQDEVVLIPPVSGG